MAEIESNFDSMTDEQIAVLGQNGDVKAVDYLLNRLKSMVKSEAKTFYIAGAEREDLIQEGMIGLYKAIMDYDMQKELKFVSFASICIKRKMYSAIEASNRKKNIPLNNYVSIDLPHDSKEDTDVKDTNTIINDSYRYVYLGPEEEFIAKERADIINKQLKEVLSPLERDILSEYIKQADYAAVARKTGKSQKAVDNALQRVRKKLNIILAKMN